MKLRLFSLTLGLLILSLASSCTSAETLPSALPTEERTPTAVVSSEALSPPEATATPSAPPADLQVVPTSRGPNLHATDPTTVSLASGGLQLVEFFRFT